MAENDHLAPVLGVGASAQPQEHLLPSVLQPVGRPVHVPLQVPAEDLGAVLTGQNVGDLHRLAAGTEIGGRY